MNENITDICLVLHLLLVDRPMSKKKNTIIYRVNISLVALLGVLVPSFAAPIRFFLCTLACLASWSGRAKDLLQLGKVQGYGRAPVCVRS